VCVLGGVFPLNLFISPGWGVFYFLSGPTSLLLLMHGTHSHANSSTNTHSNSHSHTVSCACAIVTQSCPVCVCLGTIPMLESQSFLFLWVCFCYFLLSNFHIHLTCHAIQQPTHFPSPDPYHPTSFIAPSQFHRFALYNYA